MQPATTKRRGKPLTAGPRRLQLPAAVRATATVVHLPWLKQPCVVVHYSHGRQDSGSNNNPKPQRMHNFRPARCVVYKLPHFSKLLSSLRRLGKLCMYLSMATYKSAGSCDKASCVSATRRTACAYSSRQESDEGNGRRRNQAAACNKHRVLHTRETSSAHQNAVRM